MNKKIKIIELLNKIANGEIKDRQQFIVHFNNGLTRKIYYKKERGSTICSLCNYYDNYIFQDEYDLNEYVEILEDNTEEIEELDNWFVDERKECREFDIQAINLCFSKHRDKINELVKAINQIRKEKEND